jgi:hypothetical protein
VVGGRWGKTSTSAFHQVFPVRPLIFAFLLVTRRSPRFGGSLVTVLTCLIKAAPFARRGFSWRISEVCGARRPGKSVQHSVFLRLARTCNMGKREWAQDVGAGILAPSKAHRGSMAATKSQRQRYRENSLALLPLTPWLRVLLPIGGRAFHHGEQSAALGRSQKQILLP